MTKTIATLWNGNLDPIRYLGKNNSQIKQLEALTTTDALEPDLFWGNDVSAVLKYS